jgi:prepilin signal peptidase PulO-like enzyme (type II secretory pathway)
MEKLECPHCHERAIPLWRKMCLGPATRATCPNCGARYSVPYSSMMAVIPFLIAIIAARAAPSLAVGAVVLVVGALVMSWIHYKFVPLIEK